MKIEGLKGNVDINIGNVNFYEPKQAGKSEKTENNDFDINKLTVFGNDNSSYVNAAVKIKYRDVESAKKLAIESIDQALDILKCYIHSEIPFKIISDEFIITDDNGKEIEGSYSAKGKSHYKEELSCNLEQFNEILSNNSDYFENIKKILFENHSKKFPLADKLIYSLHWYRKAFESNNVEDKLLSYWIVIENLITFDSKSDNLIIEGNETKLLLSEELVSPIELINFINSVAVDLYNYLFYLVNSSQGISEKKRHLLELPEENIEACHLNSKTDKIELKDFIKNIPPLNKLVPNKIIKDKIIFTNSFYSDNKFAHQEILKRLEQTKKDLLIIYRYRNLIVHNARFDTTILPYYNEKAKRFARGILLTILYDFVMDNTKSHEKILLSNKVKIERIMDKLKNDEYVDLFDY